MPQTQSEYLSLSQAARRVPPTKNDRPVHASTISRWVRLGCKLGDGTIIKLRATRFPGGWKVTEEALDEFLGRLTRAALGESGYPASPSVESPGFVVPIGRRQELDRVDRELDRLGF
jgi:hypothetical protein